MDTTLWLVGLSSVGVAGLIAFVALMVPRRREE
jgi:ABC-type cobalamin transport system permease subunit